MPAEVSDAHKNKQGRETLTMLDPRQVSEDHKNRQKRTVMSSLALNKFWRITRPDREKFIAGLRLKTVFRSCPVTMLNYTN